MVTLTAFADEISADFNVQLDTLQEEGIRHIEFRGAWDTGVLKLSDEELDRVQVMMEERGFKLSSIGSPIGKIKITDDFEPHLKDFERALALAKRFNVPYIRIFSFFIPEGKDPADYRDEVMRRMTELVRRAEEAGITLLHENEKEIYGDTAERCLDLFQTCASPRFRCAFDPANFVQCGVQPFTEAYPLLKPYIEYLHIKDALFKDNSVVPAGEGDGQVKEVLQAMKERDYDGFLSLEPHLAQAGTYSGFSGPDLFQVASKALKKLLVELDETWD
ncbi:sugar phosphate isomerase/epimerase [Pullulanibacillus pueri]|uniref:Xylose isomerase n=1 Tax=Pullulanibacillus pueri TaxID=1437324 RepID=A0A8J2ZY06_9BACL|nr:sugar phosphate isomerase/epimerase family protein [Pullulanibacillus pueri]MBM7682971.1 sugar phosphate isomerase/epimerase [Pullulanibacillus pueri]GGH85994.1 xylose isomerase [Pullulanibacillus pueri]